MSKFSKNIAANAFTTTIIMGFQAGSVPLFLHYWGVALYGEWLILNLVSAYFQNGDVGLNSATANTVTFAYAKRDYEKCTVLLNNNIFFITAVFGSILAVLLLLAERLLLLLHFRILSDMEVRASLVFLLGQVFLGTLNNLLNAVYRAANRFARGAMVDNYIRLFEYASIVTGVTISLSIPSILAIGIGVKAMGLALKFHDSRQFYAFPIALKYLSLDELRQMWKPAFSFMLFPLANAVALQGPVILLNSVLGGGAVVVYSTTRTLINFGRSLIDVLQRSVWPELSVAYGRGDVVAMRQLHRKSVRLSLIIVFAAFACVPVFGEFVYRHWTDHKIVWHPILAGFLLLGLLSNAVWSTSGIVLQSTNNHSQLALLYLIGSVVCLGLSFLVLQYMRAVEWLPLGLIGCDLMLIVYVLWRTLNLTEDSIAGLFSSMWVRFAGGPVTTNDLA